MVTEYIYIESKGKVIVAEADATDANQVEAAFKKIRESVGDPEVREGRDRRERIGERKGTRGDRRRQRRDD